MLVSYIRVSKSDMCIDRQIDAVAAGVDLRNIYKEKETGTKREWLELNKMISEILPLNLEYSLLVHCKGPANRTPYALNNIL